MCVVEEQNKAHKSHGKYDPGYPGMHTSHMCGYLGVITVLNSLFKHSNKFGRHKGWGKGVKLTKIGQKSLNAWKVTFTLKYHLSFDLSIP